MISLFTEEYETYTEDGSAMDKAAFAAIEPIVKEAVKKNLALRDLAYILHSAVDLSISAAILQRNVDIRKNSG